MYLLPLYQLMSLDLLNVKNLKIWLIYFKIWGFLAIKVWEINEGGE